MVSKKIGRGEDKVFNVGDDKKLHFLERDKVIGVFDKTKIIDLNAMAYAISVKKVD